MSKPVATTEEFGAGWSAVCDGDLWILLEPVDGPHGDPRPAKLSKGLWCIITSDNPQGMCRSGVENDLKRQQLHAWATRVTANYRTTVGGVGSVGDPTVWSAYESGVLVRVSDYAQASGYARLFDQAAVYVLDGNERVLVDAAGVVARRQRYRVHCWSSTARGETLPSRGRLL
jgi:hypothetical protein